MTRITISLPEDTALLVRQEAGRRGTSVSEVIRDSVVQALVGSGRRTLPFAAICDDSELPPGADLETALAESWPDDLDRSRR